MERSRNLSWQFIYRKTFQKSHKDLKGVLFLFRSAARLIVRCCAYSGFISVLQIITRRGKFLQPQSVSLSIEGIHLWLEKRSLWKYKFGRLNLIYSRSVIIWGKSPSQRLLRHISSVCYGEHHFYYCSWRFFKTLNREYLILVCNLSHSIACATGINNTANLTTF